VDGPIPMNIYMGSSDWTRLCSPEERKKKEGGKEGGREGGREEGRKTLKYRSGVEELEVMNGWKDMYE